MLLYRLTTGPGTIGRLIDVAFILLTSRSRKARFPGYKFSFKQNQVAWLAVHAFRQVLRQKQAAYREILTWLELELKKLGKKRDVKDYVAKLIAA